VSLWLRNGSIYIEFSLRMAKVYGVLIATADLLDD